MAPIVSLLMSAGPSIVRMFTKDEDSKTASILNTAADIVDTIQGKPTQEQIDQLNKVTSGLNPAVAAKLEVKLAKINLEREKAQLHLQEVQTVEEAKTHRAQVHSTDEYVRRTRPKIARESWQIAGLYGLIAGILFPILKVVFDIELPAPDPVVFAALSSPAFTYMGVRGFEKWKAGGTQV